MNNGCGVEVVWAKVFPKVLRAVIDRINASSTTMVGFKISLLFIFSPLRPSLNA